MSGHAGPARQGISVDDVADYIIVKMSDADVYLNVLKLHKLLYYVQAWHLAFVGRRLFDSSFEAWVHGPVNRPTYMRYRATKDMYSPVTLSDVRQLFRITSVAQDAKRHLDAVLQVYAKYSDGQLEEMTHRERPWQLARVGYAPNERCTVAIADDVMRTYYAARLNPGANARA